MTEWAKTLDVNKAYSELAEKHGLVNRQLRDTDRIFGLLVSDLTSNLAFRKVQRIDPDAGCYDQPRGNGEL